MCRFLTASCVACCIWPLACGISATHAAEPATPTDDVVVISTVSLAGEQVFRVRADGTGRKPLGFGSNAVLSPDGTSIAFIASDGLGKPGLNVMNADGSEPRQVVGIFDDGIPMSPSWSPDGKQIAFSLVVFGPEAGRGGGPSEMRLYVVDATGGKPKRVGNALGTNPTWSADGKQLLFVRREDRPRLCVVDLDGTNERELIKGHVSTGAWSPDGRLLAYVVEDGPGAAPRRADRSQPPGLYVAQADGTKPKRLIGGRDQIVLGPTWSRDSKRVLFTWMEAPKTKTVGGIAPDGRFDPLYGQELVPSAPSAVHVIDVDGQNVRRVTQSDEMEYCGGIGMMITAIGPADPAAARGTPRLSRVREVPPLRAKDQEVAAWVERVGGRVESEKAAISSVDLSGTKIADADLEKLNGLESLSSLRLSSTGVSDAGLKKLARHEHLTELNLSLTQVTDAGLKELANFKSLETLILHTETVTDAGLKELARVESLHRLVLSDYRITDETLKNLHEVGRLNLLGEGERKDPDSEDDVVTLNLSRSSVTDAGLTHLTGLTNLKTLNLRDTKVTDAGIKKLSVLKKLEHLDLENCPVSYAGVAKLRQALPKCAISFEITQLPPELLLATPIRIGRMESGLSIYRHNPQQFSQSRAGESGTVLEKVDGDPPAVFATIKWPQAKTFELVLAFQGKRCSGLVVEVDQSLKELKATRDGKEVPLPILWPPQDGPWKVTITGQLP